MKLIKELALVGTESGKITIGSIVEPYGAGSGSVASIAITLKADGSEPNWKVHIPKENIDAVIEALQDAKKEL